MCIGVGASDGGQRRERPLDGDQMRDHLQCLGVRLEGIGPHYVRCTKPRQRTPSKLLPERRLKQRPRILSSRPPDTLPSRP